MLKERGDNLLTLLVVLATAASQQAGSSMAPPPGLGRPFEKEENRSMDALITSMMGGVDVASNMILADNGHILAELDMYLTEKQFLAMYEPPKPEDMVKMGMMPAPLGAPMGKDKNYFFDFAEDYKGSGVRTKRKATRDVRLRWTDSIFPYTFAKGHFDLQEEYMMRRSMTEWERYTCMNFRPATQKDPNVVRFQNGVGCNSQLGMIGGVQVLNLQAPGCRFKGLYLHEIGHALGLVHEHQLPDRDKYIEILYHNVAPHMRVWFNKYASREVNQLGVPYEYSSVMHYGITAFAKDGQSQTIRAKEAEKEKTIGKVFLKELAYTDVMIVNRMYNCSSHCGNQERCGPEGHLDQNCNCICRDGSSDCDSTRRGVDRSCRNLYDSWSCYIWANQGECERNEYYMTQQCAKACGACGAQPEEHAGTCKDKFAKSKCGVWKARGDCVTNTRWMKINCKSTCDLCGHEASRPAVQCSNIHKEDHKCEEWALSGECQVNRKWMFDNCRKSCWLCDKDGVDEGEGGGDVDEDKLRCENTHETCERWASSGECRNNPTWMIPNCRQACDKCDDGTCKNLYDDIQCEIWSQKLKCITDATWMGKHCARSCRRGLCEGEEGGSTRGGSSTTTSTTSRTPSTTTTRGPRTRETTRRTRPTPTTTDSTGPCGNKHTSDTECDIWAKNGHCHINPNWMLRFCAKACGQCTDTGGGGGDDGVATTTKGTIETGGDGDCVDRHTSCPTWAKHGYCDSNPGYNLVYCKKSCNNCNGCRDAEFLCAVWAKADNCRRNPGYMLRHCQKSCNVCSKTEGGNNLSGDVEASETTTRGHGITREHNGGKTYTFTSGSFAPFWLSTVFVLFLIL